MTNTQYSLSAAHRITGRSRTTIAKHVRCGKLSVERNADGKKFIEASELMRVYGDICNFDREAGRDTRSTVKVSKNNTPTNNQSDTSNLQSLLERESEERKLERENYREQIEHLKESLAKAQDGHNRATLLLENRSNGAGDWEKALVGIEERIANQQSKSQQELEEFKKAAKEQLIQYKRALERERQKTFWQKIWSRG